MKVPKRKPETVTEPMPRLDLVPGLDELVPQTRGSHRRANAAGVGCELADE
jgi:hypothetical protein